MYIVTFYSFRGGVGRTTALVNVGFELARRGRKVLLVDFDLESPDLTSFPPLASPEPHPGIVQYVAEYRETGESPDVKEYLYPVETDEKKGRLWVMPAGRVDHAIPPDPYWEALADIDWQGLYDRQDGYMFFEDTRAQWEQLGMDYVLIDAHAGITPALGISTRQLADAVVDMGNFRQGGVDGLHEVERRISEAEQSRGKTIRILSVAASVVEEDEPYLDEGWDVAIPFSHRLLVEKQVIVANNPDSRLAKEYRRLTNELIAANFVQDRDGALLLLRKLLADPRRVLKRARDLEQIIDGFPDDPAILAQAACCLYGADRYGRALEVLDQAVDVRPNSPELLWQRASYRRRLNDPRAKSDLLTLLDVCDPQKRDWSPPSYEDRVQSALDPWAAIDWRFDLPEELRDEAVAHISDYSDKLMSLRSALLTISPAPSGAPTWDYLVSRNLQNLPEIDPYVLSAFWELRQLSAEACEEAKRKPAIASLSPDAQAILFGEHFPDREEKDSRTRIEARMWAETVTLLAPSVQQSDNWPLNDALCLFIAWWGLGNEEELKKCGKRAREQFARQGIDDLSELQMMALVCWKTGDRDLADKMLDKIDEKAAAPSHRPIFSYWRAGRVSWQQFQEDSADMRQVFKGADIPPPFLGKRPGGR